ncbi:hypothetical protein M885DRAFT_509903 [Pelagophyceae sp. CCMP2097]|nr:hypothetical protein M885DRAFT_509903 [Pelagophyceae sp. CCMP2097]
MCRILLGLLVVVPGGAAVKRVELALLGLEQAFELGRVVLVQRGELGLELADLLGLCLDLFKEVRQFVDGARPVLDAVRRRLRRDGEAHRRRRGKALRDGEQSEDGELGHGAKKISGCQQCQANGSPK